MKFDYSKIAIVLFFGITLSACKNVNSKLEGLWVCTEIDASKATGIHHFGTGYCLKFDSDSKIYESRNTSNIKNRPFSIKSDDIVIDNNPIFNVLYLKNDSLKLRNIASSVEITMVKTKNSNFQERDSLRIDSLLRNNIWEEKNTPLKITYYFDTIRYIYDNVYSFNREFYVDTVEYTTGVSWALQNFEGSLMLYYTDDGIDESIIQITDFDDNKIKGQKIEIFNELKPWEDFVWENKNLKENEIELLSNRLKGNWQLTQLYQPSANRLKKLKEEGWGKYGGGGYKRDLRFDINSLIEKEVQIDLMENQEYVISTKMRNGKSKGKWSVTKDGRYICFDNHDIDENCFRFMTEDSNFDKISIQKIENIKVHKYRRAIREELIMTFEK